MYYVDEHLSSSTWGRQGCLLQAEQIGVCYAVSATKQYLLNQVHQPSMLFSGYQRRTGTARAADVVETTGTLLSGLPQETFLFFLWPHLDIFGQLCCLFLLLL